ncbi:Gldg family protein [bacterium]|nr:Gldg family protein [bacterium]
MSSDLPPAPTTRAPDTGEPIVEFVRTQRANAAYLLLGLGVALLAVTVWLVTKGERASAAAAPPPAVDPLNPDAPPPPAPEIDTPRKGDYRFGWIATGLASLITAGAGARLLAALPKSTVAAQRTSARGFVLAVGASLGALLVVAGAVYFYRWSDSLNKWLDQNERAEMRWVVIPLLMIVAGAGLVFAAVQPARSEERNNQNLRRLVYGANLGLTVLLLLVALVILNVTAAQKVQNTLDTTETGFYTLSNATKATVAKLAEPVTAYVVFPDDGSRVVNDLRQLMFSAQEASGGKFIPKFVSPVSNKVELQQLEAKYKKLATAGYGILLTTGPEAAHRHEFIPANDIIKSDLRPGGGQQESFVGEAALVQKLRFLGDSDTKTVVYFTQGSGELALGGADEDEPARSERSAGQLKTHLESINLDVRPLRFKSALKGKGEVKTEVPADAAVVIVADPEAELPEAGVKALRDYATGPRKGKLVILTEPRPAPGAKDKRMAKTGIEGLAADLGVKIGEKYIYSFPLPQFQLGPRNTSVVFASTATGEHPIIQPFPQLRFTWGVARELSAAGAGPGGFTVTPLMSTLPRRPTWLEDEELDSPLQAYQELIESETLIRAKAATERGRWVAVASAEGGTPPNPMNPHAAGGEQKPRLVVYANASMFSNAAPPVRGGGTPPSYELMSASIDWLRERPVIAAEIEAKPYTVYNFPAAESLNETRLIWLPLGLALFAVAGLGAGVWVIRRK